LFLVLLDVACQSMATAFAQPGNTGRAKFFCFLLSKEEDSTFFGEKRAKRLLFLTSRSTMRCAFDKARDMPVIDAGQRGPENFP
jgi:hypothetical protein